MKLEFGSRVLVSHVLQRFYVDADTEKFILSSPGGPAVFHQVPLYFSSRYGERCDGPDGLPGLPLGVPSAVPDTKGTYRVIRRVPVGHLGDKGVLIGRSRMLEGRRWGGEPAEFQQSRSVPVLQVAFQTDKLQPMKVFPVDPADLIADPVTPSIY